MSHLVAISNPATGEDVIANMRAVKARLAEKERQARVERIRANMACVAPEPPAVGVEAPTAMVVRDYIWVASDRFQGVSQYEPLRSVVVDDIQARRRQYPLHRIRLFIAKAARHYGFGVSDIYGPSRRGEVTKVRMWLVALVKRLRTDISASTIGRMFGGRDHTTILHSIDKSLPRPVWEPSLRRVKRGAVRA